VDGIFFNIGLSWSLLNDSHRFLHWVLCRAQRPLPGVPTIGVSYHRLVNLCLRV
jgi:hypothetical protein